VAIRILGEAYLAAGAVELAQIQFNKSVQLEPGYWRNYKAIDMTPDDYRYWGYAGEVSLQLTDGEAPGFFRRAIELATPARVINPNDSYLIGDPAAYHAALGDRDSAIDLITQAKSLNPDDVDVLYQEALVWARLDERDRLEKVIAQLIKAGYSEALIKRDANFGGSANSNHAIPRKSAPQSVPRDVFVGDSLGEPEIDS